MPIHFGDTIFQDFHALAESFGETFFFFLQYPFDLFLSLSQFWIGFAHLCNQRRNQFIEEGILYAQTVTVANRPADDAA